MSDDERPSDEGGDEDTGSLTFLQLVGSALAAGFGVQSSKNRERDFSRGKPLHFIIIGIVLTALFVLTVIGVVNLVLNLVGSE